MEALLKQSGKFFNGLLAQTLCLLFASTLFYVNVALIFEFISHERIVVNQFDIPPDETKKFNFLNQPNYLIYEHPLLSLSPTNEKGLTIRKEEESQFFPGCIIQASIFGGIVIGLCFSWFLFSSLRPKIILLSAIFINAILIFLNAFIPYFWLFVGFRIGIGIILAIGHTSIALLLLDWSHASNQPLAIHFMFSTRSIAVLIVAFILSFGISWRNFFFVHPCLFIITLISNFIFVNESPRWLRRHGKLSEYSTLVVDFGKKLGRTINGENSVFADDLESRDPEKRAPLPTPAELTALTGFYIVNAVASVILQGSASYSLPWSIEILILACIYLLAAIVTTPLYSYGKIPVIVFTLTAILITVMLLFIPHGIFYGTLLQAAKFNSAVNDHFAIFLLFTVVSPRMNERWPAMTQREWRARVLLGIETFSVLARIFAIFFVLRSEDSMEKSKRIPKLAIVLGCYGFGLILVILGRYVFKRGIAKQTIRKPSKDTDEESNKPFIPRKPDDIEKPRPRPTKPVNPPPEIQPPPSTPDPDEIVIGDENDDDDVDIDI